MQRSQRLVAARGYSAVDRQRLFDLRVTALEGNPQKNPDFTLGKFSTANWAMGLASCLVLAGWTPFVIFTLLEARVELAILSLLFIASWIFNTLLAPIVILLIPLLAAHAIYAAGKKGTFSWLALAALMLWTIGVIGAWRFFLTQM